MTLPALEDCMTRVALAMMKARKIPRNSNGDWQTATV